MRCRMLEQQLRWPFTDEDHGQIRFLLQNHRGDGGKKIIDGVSVVRAAHSTRPYDPLQLLFCPLRPKVIGIDTIRYNSEGAAVRLPLQLITIDIGDSNTSIEFWTNSRFKRCQFA